MTDTVIPHDRIEEGPGTARVAAVSDVVVVGGGPAGIAAAVAARREGASVTLVERYPYLGGLASGGMVLVLDDMHNGDEVTTTGLVTELIERMAAVGAAVYPPPEERRQGWDVYRKWARWGAFDFRAQSKPAPIVMAAAFDPDGFKRVSNALVGEAGVNVRLHSWFSKAIVRDGRVRGVICETKAGREAILGDVVIDTSGDLDVAAAAGARFSTGKYIVTTVFRLGGVDADANERFQAESPEDYARIDREAKRVMGGSWDFWWLKTPLPGIVWCNCPHMTGYDALDVADLSRADVEGRRRIYALVDFVRANMPGFEKSFVVDVAPQLGVRTTRLLEGEYVVTKEDVRDRVHFADTVARGRDYYTPYRAMLPRDVDGLLVAGRHYSATESAQKMSREIPPCMAMGQSAGVAAALAVAGGLPVRRVEPSKICERVRAQGGDPGDRPSANATVLERAA
jgi:glycine/D-amino acid oxidase-like deaminating enzyme